MQHSLQGKLGAKVGGKADWESIFSEGKCSRYTSGVTSGGYLQWDSNTSIVFSLGAT